MNAKDLKEYINFLADMESHVYLLQILIKFLKDYSMSLGKPQNIEKPSEPARYANSPYVSSFVLSILTFITGCFIIKWGNKLSDPLTSGVLEFLAGLLFIVPLGGLCLIGGLVILIFAFKEVQQVKKDASKYNADMRKYMELLAYYDKRSQNDRVRIAKEKKVKSFIDAEIQAAEVRLVQSNERLQEMYSFGVVYPKYRNMVMINSICEYLNSGRCSTLDGQSGAYNILENEMRLDRIVLQLDQVIANLDQIKQNQYMLYLEIEQGNKKANEIVQATKDLSIRFLNMQIQEEDYSQKLRNLQENSCLTVYNLERISIENKYLDRIRYFAKNVE